MKNVDHAQLLMVEGSTIEVACVVAAAVLTGDPMGKAVVVFKKMVAEVDSCLVVEAGVLRHGVEECHKPLKNPGAQPNSLYPGSATTLYIMHSI